MKKGKPGGVIYDPVGFRRDTIRAELVERVSNFAIGQASKIVDALLEDYSIEPKRTRKYP